MTEPAPDYSVLSQVHGNDWSEKLGRSVTGWTVTVQDAVTGTVVPVFVPDGYYNVENVRAAVEQALIPVREVHQLGR